MKIDEKLKNYYNEWWENPKDIRNTVFETLNSHIRTRIPPGRGRKALDIGSGKGRIVSYLLEKGYEVTAIEFNEKFALDLKNKYPQIKVISDDIRKIKLNQCFNVITCIELIQNLKMQETQKLLGELAIHTDRLFINISNSNSFHGKWVKMMKFQADFVFDYEPNSFDNMINQAGFIISHRKGIGLITPVSLFKGFKGVIVPVCIAKIVNNLDSVAPRICHLYYVEAKKPM